MARGNRHLYRVNGTRLFAKDGQFLRWTTKQEVEELGSEVVPHLETRGEDARQVGYRYRGEQDQPVTAAPVNRTSPSGFTVTDMHAFVGIAHHQPRVAASHAKLHHWRKLERRVRRKLTTYPDLVQQLLHPQVANLGR